jgi:hypothetical protein
MDKHNNGQTRYCPVGLIQCVSAHLRRGTQMRTGGHIAQHSTLSVAQHSWAAHTCLHKDALGSDMECLMHALGRDMQCLMQSLIIRFASSFAPSRVSRAIAYVNRLLTLCPPALGPQGGASTARQDGCARHTYIHTYIHIYIYIYIYICVYIYIYICICMA